MLTTIHTVITAIRAYGMNWYSERRWLVPGVILCLLFVGPTFAIVSLMCRDLLGEDVKDTTAGVCRVYTLSKSSGANRLHDQQH